MITIPVDRKLVIKIKVKSIQSQLSIRLDILNFDAAERSGVGYYW